MKQILPSLIFLLFLETISLGQEISRHEADSMLMKLNKTKSNTDRMELLLNLAQFHIFKPGENKIDLDSAAVYIDQAKAQNINLNNIDAYGYLLLTESYLIKERGDKVGGKKVAEKAITILEAGTNKDYLGQAYFEVSTYYNYNDSIQLLKKIQLVQQSVNSFQHSKNLLGKAKSLQMLGDLCFWNDEDNRSIQALQQSLSIYDSINYPNQQGALVILGEMYFFHHDYAPALSYLLRALKTAQLTQDSSMQLCQIYNHLALLYKEIDRLDLSVNYYKGGLEIAKKNGDVRAIFQISVNISAAYFYLNQPNESLKVLAKIPSNYPVSSNRDKIFLNAAYLRTYLALGDLDSTRRYCRSILNLVDKSPEPDIRCNLYRDVAHFFLLTSDYSRARYYLNKSITIAEENNYDYGRFHNLELSYKLDSVLGNFKAAFNHLLQYKEKTDSASGVRNIRQFQVMNVEYEVQMKEDSIRSKNRDIALLTQKNNLQHENLRQASLIKNITVTGIILALIVIGLLYRQYRRKQKNNQIITQKNEQLQHLNEQQTKLLVEKDWLVKEIHHRVKNNLQMVVSLLNAQTEFLTHPSAIDAIKESRERMQAIAIIHQKLYQLDNSTNVNMRSYVNELVDNIKNSFADSERIHFKIDVADVSLDISQSVPLGLILNEAITNAIKYAYPKNQKGLIQIFLRQYDKDKLQLKVTDNGKGLPADVDIKHSNSLGIQLITLFSEQLEGDLYFKNNNGLEITLNFKFFENKNIKITKKTAC